jgi:ketosteroid isomerase-like protein
VELSGEYGQAGDVEAAIGTVRAIYDAFARRDLQAALEHMDPEISFVPSGTAARVGRDVPYVGHDGIRRYFADVARVWRELTLHADDIRATGEGVIVFGTVTGVTDDGPYAARAIWIWRVRGGKAISMRARSLGDQPPSA